MKMTVNLPEPELQLIDVLDTDAIRNGQWNDDLVVVRDQRDKGHCPDRINLLRHGAPDSDYGRRKDM
jgi:hypothetical protein